MDLYRHISSHFIAPLWAKWEKSDYLKHIEYLKELQFLSPEEIKGIQWRKIKALLNHAYKNCSYYNELFDKIALHPDDIKTWSDLKDIPVLTKDKVRNNYKDLIAGNIDKKTLISGMTSGSTGKPLHFLADEKGLQWARAHCVLTQQWAGWRMGEKIFAVMGIHANEKRYGIRRYLRNKLLDRICLLNTLELDENSMFTFYELLRRADRPFIHGFAHAIYLFAQYLEQQGLTDLHACGVMTGGMVLSNHERSLMERVFHCKVFNRYGTEEMGVIACECERHEGLHISEGNYYIEVLNGDRRTLPGQMGSLIVTDLHNHGMPFIRYQIEDMAVPSDSACSCGRTWCMIKEIAGRTSDFIITPEKKIVSGISLTDFFALIPGIIQIQIVQDRVDHLNFKIVRSEEFNDESMKRLKSIEHQFFGDKMRVSYDYVDSIPKEPRGKFRFVKSEIAKDFLGYPQYL
ncbi:MAG: phenylacetate--CoA ligase family protein [Candidatus Hodarchaeota archaeon]